jgi:hypothetical protein
MRLSSMMGRKDRSSVTHTKHAFRPHDSTDVCDQAARQLIWQSRRPRAIAQ